MSSHIASLFKALFSGAIPKAAAPQDRVSPYDRLQAAQAELSSSWRDYYGHPHPGVVADFPEPMGTGARRFAQDTTEIGFSR